MSDYLPTPVNKKAKAEKPAPAKEQAPVEPAVPAEPPAPKPPRKPGELPDWASGALSAGYIVLLVVVAILVFGYMRNLFSGGSHGFTLVEPTVGPGTPTAGQMIATNTLPPLSAEGPKPWNGVDRVTILVMGIDERDIGAVASRTDTMMLMSMDPITKTASVLSIPRDLYVEIPGYGFDRINKAYFLGDADKRPGGGPQLAMDTVSRLLGVPINYYAVVNFDVFTKFVDRIGGIDVYVPFDNMKLGIRNGHEVLLFYGNNHLDGSMALAYARDRHASATSPTGGSDYDRAARTQQVILAIRDRILQLNMLPALIAQAPEIYNDFVEGVHTNLTLDTLIGLSLVAKDVDRKQIQMAVIGPQQLRAQESIIVNGVQEDVGIPNLDLVRELRDKLFASNTPLGYPKLPEAGDLLRDALEENAKISIRNGAGVPGLAGKTKDYLVGLGFPDANVFVDYTPWATDLTQLFDYSGMPKSIRYFLDAFHIADKNYFLNFDFNPAQLAKRCGTDAEGKTISCDMLLVIGPEWTVP